MCLKYNGKARYRALSGRPPAVEPRALYSHNLLYIFSRRAMTRLTREQLRQRYAELRDLVNEWDPIGVMDDPEWPRDEYDCLVGPVLRHLEAGDARDVIVAFLTTELADHFGLDRATIRPHMFVERAATWFAARWEGTGPVPAPD